MDTFQIYNLLAAIPVFLVWGVGGVICLRWSTRRPVTAMLVGLSVLIAIVREIAWGFRTQVSDLLEPLFATAEMRMLAMYLTFSIPNTLAWGCVLLAVCRELRQASRDQLSASNEAL